MKFREPGSESGQQPHNVVRLRLHYPQITSMLGSTAIVIYFPKRLNWNLINSSSGEKYHERFSDRR